jgi:hypothetical protein
MAEPEKAFSHSGKAPDFTFHKFSPASDCAEWKDLRWKKANASKWKNQSLAIGHSLRAPRSQLCSIKEAIAFSALIAEEHFTLR